MADVVYDRVAALQLVSSLQPDAAPICPAPAETLPADVLALIIESQLSIGGDVVGSSLCVAASVGSCWRAAVRVVVTRRRLLCCDRIVGPAPESLPHGGPFDGPKAVAPLPTGGVLVADTRNNRLRRVSRAGGLLDGGCEMGTGLPDSIALQRLGLDKLAVWATDRSRGANALVCGLVAARGRSGRPVCFGGAFAGRRVVSVHYSDVLGVALLLFADCFEAARAEAEHEAEEGEPRTNLDEAHSRKLGFGSLSGNALCLTSFASSIFVGDGGHHAVLVYGCTAGCAAARHVRCIGGHGEGSVHFREPSSVAVGRSGSGAREEALLHVADWNRLVILTLDGSPLQVLPMHGFSTRRISGVCVDADDEHLWLVSAEHHTLYRYAPLDECAQAKLEGAGGRGVPYAAAEGVGAAVAAGVAAVGELENEGGVEEADGVDDAFLRALALI